MDTQWKLDDLIASLGLTMTCQRVTANPNMPDQSMTHYSCHLSWPEAPKSERLHTYFSMGSAHDKEPDIATVLDCLASDAAGYEDARSFDEWAEEYGFDSDSRKAERIYTTVGEQSEQLRAFMGNQYDALLWETERC